MIDAEQAAKGAADFKLAAVGLGLLRREGAQGAVRLRRDAAQALLRARPRAPERRVLRRATSSTASPSRSAHDLPVYQPDVRVFEVFDADGSRWRSSSADYVRAPVNKQGGAWMNSYVDQSELLGTKPVVANHLNIPKPPAGQPTLLTFDEVDDDVPRVRPRAARHVLEREVPAASPAPTCRATSSSIPSQFNEMWARLSRGAARTTPSTTRPARRCRRTCSTRCMAAQKFNQGFATTEYLGRGDARPELAPARRRRRSPTPRA